MRGSVRLQPQQTPDIRQRSERSNLKPEQAKSRPGEHAPAASPESWLTLRLPTIGNAISLILALLAIVGRGPYGFTKSIHDYSSLTRLCLLSSASIITLTIHTYLAFFSRAPSAGQLSSFMLVMMSSPIFLYVSFTIFAEWERLVAGEI
ncbi:hypothetical protein V8F20_012789 [Naviculisporaceae sp. PSN 640]